MSQLDDRDAIERKLSRLLSKLTLRQMDDLLALMGNPPNIYNIPASFWDEAGIEMTRSIAPIFEDVFLTQAQKLMAETTIGLDWALVSGGAVDWANSYAFDLVSGINETSQKLVQSSVARYFEQGQTIGQLENSLIRVFGPARAEMIAVTEVTRAATQGEIAYAQELLNQGVRMVPVWQTNNDEISCPICGPLNGTEITNRVFPPAHPRCRCWVNHVLPGSMLPTQLVFNNMGSQAMMDYYSGWRDTLNDSERQSIRRYAGGSFTGMNDRLRRDIPRDKWGENFQTLDSNLRGIIARSPGMPENGLLYRHLTHAETYNALESGLLKAGDVLKDKAFMSTSIVPRFGQVDAATQRANETFKAIRFHIEAPKGFKGAFISHPSLQRHVSEGEFLIGPGTPLTIMGFEKVAGAWIVRLRAGIP